MSRTPFFTGDGASFDRDRAGESARRLAVHHPDLGYQLLFSAASYVLRDKRALRDSAVLEEARRRSDMLDRAISNREARFR